ncbi:MAG TPA: type IV toxin-antitoxin system AbiEi family antitoxin domain-containing protein [Acidimicrobiales bacterium]|nr:type IV toxin-antitoxin system AbiEi family antitoxin domain-containing protein [Acidimicrobiales bacterium]
MKLHTKAARVAHRQYGMLTYAQALELGYSRSQIRTHVSTGAWVEIRKGVYIVGAVPPSWEQTLCAVTLGFDDCWISHGTAGRLQKLKHAPLVDGIEILRPYGKHRRVDGVIEHRSRIITPADVTRVQRLPVTSIGRTIVECSGRLTPKQTGEMIDDAKRRHPQALEETRAAFARVASGGRRRLRGIRAALGLRIPGYDPGESDLELRALRVLVAAGLPMPVQQLRVTLNGQRRRIDLAYPDLKIAIELLGWEWHGGRAAFDADHARSNELVAIGFRLLQFTSETSDADMVRLVTQTRAIAA